jgi:hypothetical protein
MPSLGSQSLVRLLPTTRYDFSALRSGSITLPLVQRVDVLGYDVAALQLRVLSGELPPGSTMTVLIADDGYDPEAPDAPFMQTQSQLGEDLASVQISSNTVFPFYQTVATTIPGKLGRMMAVLVSFNASESGGPCVSLSMDLLLSGRVVGRNVQQPATFRGYVEDPTEELEFYTRMESAPAAPLGDEVINRVINAIGSALRGVVAAEEYPRFGNVNVAISRFGPGVQGDPFGVEQIADAEGREGE